MIILPEVLAPSAGQLRRVAADAAFERAAGGVILVIQPPGEFVGRIPLKLQFALITPVATDPVPLAGEADRGRLRRGCRRRRGRLGRGEGALVGLAQQVVCVRQPVSTNADARTASSTRF